MAAARGGLSGVALKGNPNVLYLYRARTVRVPAGTPQPSIPGRVPAPRGRPGGRPGGHPGDVWGSPQPSIPARVPRVRAPAGTPQPSIPGRVPAPRGHPGGHPGDIRGTSGDHHSPAYRPGYHVSGSQLWCLPSPRQNAAHTPYDVRSRTWASQGNSLK